MKFTRSIAILGVAVATGFGWYVSRPVTVLTADTLLWASEDDAARQGTTFPGPGIPLSRMEKGDRLRVIRITGGKDYRAYFVMGPHGQKGWVLSGQRGVTLSAS